jgi:chemotaxis protein methyltransferase CheR
VDDALDLEVDLVLEALRRGYGYDFRGYARATIRRRLQRHVERAGLAHVSDLVPRLVHDPASVPALVGDLTIGVTALFRDPQFFRALRETVLPRLRDRPALGVWAAGCATGEEVWSVAILLSEAALFDRARIRGTDLDPRAVGRAREAIYTAERLRAGAENYRRAGGTASLTRYFHSRYDAAIVDRELRERTTFAPHDVAADPPPAGMHLVLCRNVLIYFEPALRDRALGRLCESLAPGGFLCLGMRESLVGTPVAGALEAFDAGHRIYRRGG